MTEQAITTADPGNPGVQARPAPGIQFVGIPEFTDLGTQVSQGVSSAIAGRTSVNQALADGQRLAEQVAEKYAASDPVGGAGPAGRSRHHRRSGGSDERC
ncbi:hypothetical protein GCM10027614_71800 [Micromonospora vulcania]